MSHPIRTLSITVFLAAATLAHAQTNPLDRDLRKPLYVGTIDNQRPFSPPIGGTNPTPINAPGAVTPVPEPSEWMMMLAGLAVVGVIVGRNSKRS